MLDEDLGFGVDCKCPAELNTPLFLVDVVDDLLGDGETFVTSHVTNRCAEAFGREGGESAWMEAFHARLGRQLETDGGIVADLANSTPQREEFFGRNEDARLREEILRKRGAAQNGRSRDACFFQPCAEDAWNAEVPDHADYSELSDAMSIEKRYLTSDLRRRS